MVTLFKIPMITLFNISIINIIVYFQLNLFKEEVYCSRRSVQFKFLA